MRGKWNKKSKIDLKQGVFLCKLKMRLITDIKENKGLIEASIKKYGHGAEHNYWNLRYLDGKKTKSAFFSYEDGSGIMCIMNGKSMEMLPGILAPEKNNLGVLKGFLDYALFKESMEKVFVVLPAGYKEAISRVKRYKVPKYQRTFYLPVYNLKKWDNSMPGKKWKKLRNLFNKLHSHHKVLFTPCRDIDRGDLRKIVGDWKKKRGSTEGLWQPQFYDNIIENNFKGLENARSLVVDGIPCTISGGWRIAHSNNYYSALGLSNYKFEGVGEVSTIYELNLLRRKEYSYVNFGQSDKPLLDFKKKFYPEKIEAEVLFSASKSV